jgi:polyphosphate kinase
MWKDNRQAWELRPDGSYEQRRPPAEGPEQATHRVLLEHAREIMRAG